MAMDLDTLLLRGSQPGNAAEKLEELRHHVLVNGIPSSRKDGTTDAASLKAEIRPYVWLILLNAQPMTTDHYLDVLKLGASPSHKKIRDDTFRTFPQDPLFRQRVTEYALTRMLNCMAWKLVESHDSKNKGWKSPSSAEITGAASSPANSAFSTSSPSTAELANVGYKQGMNVLAGVCHYACKGEVEAYAFFEKLITKEIPGYFRGTLDGVHRGCELVGEILSVCDPKLATFFAEKGWAPGVYAFQHVLTLCASTPPLPEVLKLWDFLFAAGPHMNLICIVAQLMLIKDQLLAGAPPRDFPRKMPNLEADKVKMLAIRLVAELPDELYERLVSHAK